MLLPLECEPNWYVVIHSVPLHFTLPALYSSQSSSLQVLQQITLGVSDGSFHTLEYLNYLQSSYFERQLPGETVLNFSLAFAWTQNNHLPTSNHFVGQCKQSCHFQKLDSEVSDILWNCRGSGSWLRHSEAQPPRSRDRSNLSSSFQKLTKMLQNRLRCPINTLIRRRSRVVELWGRTPSLLWAPVTFVGRDRAIGQTCIVAVSR